MKKVSISIFSMVLCAAAIAQNWTSIGPEGGFFKDFLIHPTDNNIVYAGSDDGGGVWKTTDGGNSWVCLTDDFLNFTGWNIEMAPNDPNTLYFCDVYGRGTVLRTTDGGTTITQLSDGFVLNKDRQISDVAVSPLDAMSVWASSGDGIGSNDRIGNGVFSSANGGETWAYAGLQGITVPAIEISDAGTVLAATYDNGLQIRAAGDLEWSNHPDIPAVLDIIQLEKKGSVIAACAGAQGVYLSTDDGVSFSAIGNAGEFNFDLAIIEATPHVKLIVSGFSAPSTYTSETGIWTVLDDALFNDKVAIGLAADGDLMYMGVFSSTLILKSTDGGSTWAELQNNPVAAEVHAILNAEGNRLYASLQNGYDITGAANNVPCVAYSGDGGTTWSRQGPIAHGLDMERSNALPENVFLGTFANGLFRSSDNFVTWENIRQGNVGIGDIEAGRGEFSDRLFISEINFATQVGGTYMSTDEGDNWAQVFPQIPNVIYTLEDGTVFFGMNNNCLVGDIADDMFSTTLASAQGQKVISITDDGENVFIGTETGKIFKLSGEFFQVTEELSVPWNEPLPNKVQNLTYWNDALIAGLSGAEQDTLSDLNGGIWYSLNAGNSWVNADVDITNNNIFGYRGLDISQDGGLLAATYGRGVFELDQLPTGVEELQNPTLEAVVFPNPTSDFAFVKMPNGNKINQVRVFDLNGKLVAVQEGLNAPSVQLELGSLAEGLYMVVVNGGGAVASARVFVK